VKNRAIAKIRAKTDVVAEVAANCIVVLLVIYMLA
jgi:hypothetical protein